MKTIGMYFILTSVILTSCTTPSLETVEEVDLEKFMGTWFEIAALPTTYNKGCTCSKVDMELAPDNEYIKVINSCMKKGKQGAVLAKAYVEKNSANTKLEVQLFWPFRSDYDIIALDSAYSYAMAGNPDRTILQVLSRQEILDENIYMELIGKAHTLGFDIAAIVKTAQNCP